MFRPRRGLAKVLYEKIHTDARLQSMDKKKWYCIDEERMRNISIDGWRRFEPLEMDESTQMFLDKCHENSDNTLWQLWLTAASSLLSWFITATSINGLLGRGSMHVFSPNQFQTLIIWDSDNPKLERLLDIGAGDGETTRQMESCFNEVYVTEMSTPMKWTLEKKGYRVLNESEWHTSKDMFDVVSCLNVLDRCESPLTLLNSIKNVLRSDGIAIVSFVIPFKPYVEFGNSSTEHIPLELLPISGSDFEEEVYNFIDKVLKPNGWEVVKWTRLPYLCEGDIKQAFYFLDDAVFVIRPMLQADM